MLGWWAKDHAEGDRGADLRPKICVGVQMGRFPVGSLRSPPLRSEEAADVLGSAPDTRDILANMFWPQVSREDAPFGRGGCLEREHFCGLQQSISQDGLYITGKANDV